LFVGILFCNSVAAGRDAWNKNQGATRTHGGHKNLYAMAVWIDENLPPGSIVAGPDAGILGYYSGRTVVNMDGVINDEAIEAIKTKSLEQYLRERGVTYLAGASSQLDKFMDGYSGVSNWREDYVMVYEVAHVVLLRKLNKECSHRY